MLVHFLVLDWWYWTVIAQAGEDRLIRARSRPIA
jgi:hypothetical protein